MKPVMYIKKYKNAQRGHPQRQPLYKLSFYYFAIPEPPRSIFYCAFTVSKLISTIFILSQTKTKIFTTIYILKASRTHHLLLILRH